MTNSIECVEKAEVFLVTGSNTTENHPIIGHGVRRALARGAKLILFDPRRIGLSRLATLWCRMRPGTDVAWINGLMHVIINEGLADLKFVKERTEGFEEVKKLVARYNPILLRGLLTLSFAVDLFLMFLGFKTASITPLYLGKAIRGFTMAGGMLLWELGPQRL